VIVPHSGVERPLTILLAIYQYTRKLSKTYA
jgi:hypothetical protein